tara:strand:+ start:772 stop:915 length:144 start_codon:yes stop_codon:yes gene_type:complete
MAQIYSENTSNSEQLKPKDKTVRFLLDYSKSYFVMSLKKAKIEAFLN